MIYVSSSCIKAQSIRQSVAILANEGFKAIELSGGSEYYPQILEDLLELKEKYNLQFACHNYFPPPKNGDFVINLSSLDSAVFERSLEHLHTALEWNYLLGSKHFGFHAGFFLPLASNELGISHLGHKHRIYDKDKAIEQFIKGYKVLQESAKKLDIALYIENNVISSAYAKKYGTWDLAMLLCLEDLTKLQESIDCKLLLDVGHLKVSANTMGRDFMNELLGCAEVADYIHLSDNNGLSDENKAISMQSEFLPILASFHHSQKKYTLEVYDGLDSIKRSYEVARKIFE
nr:TIM barrel protein [uncultured Helicobacter sp.]